MSLQSVQNILLASPHKNLLPFKNGQPITKGILSLRKFLENNEFGNLKRDQELQNKWGEGLLAGVGYLHSKGLVHGHLSLDCLSVDLRTDELLVGHLNCCINSSQLKSLDEVRVVSDRYAPPEKFNGDRVMISTKTDVWACGVLLYFIFNKKFAFDKAVKPTSAAPGCWFQWHSLFDAEFRFEPKYSNLVVALKQMLVTLPENRLELKEVNELLPLVVDFSDVNVCFD